MNNFKLFAICSPADCGKTLLRKLFQDNLSDTVDVRGNQCDPALNNIDITTDDLTYDRVKDIILRSNCVLIRNKHILSYLTASILRRIYKGSTDKNFVYLKNIDFGIINMFLDHGIFIYRDPRICWLVTNHRKDGLEAYIQRYINPFLLYDRLNDKSKIIIIKYEDFIKDQKTQSLMLFNKLGIPFNKEFIEVSERYNQYMTKIDLYNIHMQCDDGRKVSNNDFRVIEDVCKRHDVFKQFNMYPDGLTLQSVLPSISDINDYVNFINTTKQPYYIKIRNKTEMSLL